MQQKFELENPESYWGEITDCTTAEESRQFVRVRHSGQIDSVKKLQISHPSQSDSIKKIIDFTYDKLFLPNPNNRKRVIIKQNYNNEVFFTKKIRRRFLNEGKLEKSSPRKEAYHIKNHAPRT